MKRQWIVCLSALLLAVLLLIGTGCSLAETEYTDAQGNHFKVVPLGDGRYELWQLVERFMTAMAPLVTAMCISAGFGPSRSLLALLFGAQFGGFVTLVGVGSNATANEVMAQNGLNPFGFFSITPFGIGVCAVMPGDISTGFTAARRKENAGDDIYHGAISRSVAKMEHDEQHGMDPKTVAHLVCRLCLQK